MDFLNFPDKCVRYSTFLNDVAAKVVHMIKQDANDPEFISQNKAFRCSVVAMWSGGASRAKSLPTNVRAKSNTVQRPAAIAEDTTRLP